MIPVFMHPRMSTVTAISGNGSIVSLIVEDVGDEGHVDEARPRGDVGPEVALGVGPTPKGSCRLCARGVGPFTLTCSGRTGDLAQFGRVAWHSPGARIGPDGARKWR